MPLILVILYILFALTVAVLQHRRLQYEGFLSGRTGVQLNGFWDRENLSPASVARYPARA
ncbi:MAG: hypothetical protein ACLP7I_12605 [Limisphaerales bacterium]